MTFNRFKEVFIKTLLSILLVIITGLYVSAHYFESSYAEVGGINPRQVKVSLRKYPNRSSTVIATLGAGSFASLTKPTNKWNYFYSVNQDLTIQKQDFKLGYSRVFGFLLLKTKQLRLYEKQVDTFSPHIIISLLTLLLLLSFVSYRKRHQQNYSSQSFNTIEPLEAVHYIQPQLSSHREPLSPQEIESIASGYIEPLSLDSGKTNDQEKEELRKIEDSFYRKAKDEINATYQNDIAEMKKTIFSLQEKYKDAEKKANILGVNLNDSKIDNLVKGRLFELFAATVWDRDDRTTIDDWTPDKGFNEKIFVKSNGNPDFVVSNAEINKVVAVECKFRSRFNKNKNNEAVFVNFGHEKSINRYKEYQTEKNITVFLLLGVGGVAEQPENLYLLTLGDINKIRIKTDKYSNVPTVRKNLAPYKINEYELIDYLF